MISSAALRVQAALDLVDADPSAALALAEQLLEEELEAEERVSAIWARGWSLRELHQLELAVSELERALEEALRLGLADVSVRISVSLALAMMYVGRPDVAVTLLEGAERDARAEDLVHVLLQKSLIFHRLGHHDDALHGYLAALRAAEDLGDEPAQARLHANATVLHAERNDLDEARHHAAAAVELATRNGLDLLAAGASHNLGYAVARSGEIPEALELMQRADDQIAQLEGVAAHLAVMRLDHCEVLLGANLVTEALRLGRECLVVIESLGNANERADAHLMSARIHRANGDFGAALVDARNASSMFESQGRTAFTALAELIELEALAQIEGADDLADRAEACAGALGDSWPVEQAVALALACRGYVQDGSLDSAERVLGRLRQAGRKSAVQVAAQHLAAALVHEGAGRLGAARRSVTAGLATLKENRASLGPAELRAYATVHTSDLVEVGIRLALVDRRARDVLRVLEARGGIPLHHRAAGSPALDEALSQLREVADELRSESLEPDHARMLASRRHALEARVRTLTRSSQTSWSGASTSMSDAMAALGQRGFLAFVEVQGSLLAVSMSSGRTYLHELGEVDSIAHAIESMDFSLQRLQRSQSSDASRASARELLISSARDVAARVIPRRLLDGDQELVIVPSPTVAGLPWAAVPSLTGRPLTVTSSLRDWTGRRVDSRRASSCALVAGPGLASAESEVDRLRVAYPDARSMTGVGATSVCVREALESSAIAHFACHGTFRADNPMFSSLRLADGDLTIYDLEQCERLPETMVLSACNTGQNAVLLGGALLGMASALMQLGVSSVIAPLTPVNDERSVDLMVRLHTHLAAGVPAAAALAKASIGPDGELDPTAAPFICFGS